MIEQAMAGLPVLTEVVDPAPAAVDAQVQQWLVQCLPGLVREAVLELQPQFEQQLLDALMPRLLASVVEWQTGSTLGDDSGSPRLP